MTSEDAFPQAPVLSEQMIDECRRDADPIPILFEWYKYLGILCQFGASISPESPSAPQLPPAHFAAVRGLLHRCARLMLSVEHLSADRVFGETIALLTRCICESAIKVAWLCEKRDSESFVRYLADGLRQDQLLKELINRNIAQSGQKLVIESRMLKSIDGVMRCTGLTEQEVAAAKKLPNLSDMYLSLGIPDGLYLAIQRMGSHSVHGTWTDLLTYYLDESADGKLTPRDHGVEPHPNHYFITSLIVIEALVRFFRWLLSSEEAAAEGVVSYLEGVREKLIEADGIGGERDFTEDTA